MRSAIFFSILIGLFAGLATACDDGGFEGDEAMEPRALQLSDSVDALLDALPPHLNAAMRETDDALAFEKAYYNATTPVLGDIAYWLGQIDRCGDAGGAPPDTAELWRLHDAAAGHAATHLLTTAFAGDDLVLETYRREEMLYQIEMTEAMGTLRSQPIFEPDTLALYSCPPQTVSP